MAPQETVIRSRPFTLGVRGRIGGKELSLGLTREHILFYIGLTIIALMLYIAALNEGMTSVSELLAHVVTVILFRIKTIDGLEGKSLTFRAFPLGIINDYQQKE